jgi:peptide/nickel transport system permease protein
MMRSFSDHRWMVPAAVLVVVVGLGLGANGLAPHSPHSGRLVESLMPPAWMPGGGMTHPLGTDALGRDMASRMLFAIRFTLIVALLALSLGGAVGTVVGLIAGFYGGWVDSILMRLADTMIALPMILLGLMLAITFGPSFAVVTGVLALVLWARFARLVRADVLSIKTRDFVALARVAGLSSPRILLRHVLPNVMNTILVVAALQVGQAILTEASLSFLGVGIPPPNPSLGSMVAEGRQYISAAWWVSVVPGAAIVLIVLALNMAGDWLRDRLDPRLRQL